MVVDLLVLRRRLPGAAPDGPGWIRTDRADVGAYEARFAKDEAELRRLIHLRDAADEASAATK